MAKVSLIKITPIKSGEIKEVEINGEKVQVRQYLPTAEKIALTERVLAGAFDESNRYSMFRLNILMEIEIIKAYTNFNITEKQMENIPNLYDLLVLNDIIKQVNENIPEEELIELRNKIYDEADNLEKYLNSLIGLMKTITTDYDATKINVDELTNKLDNPEALKTVKEILDKIG